ncbi:MAG: tyrosine-protein phosphatase [Gammaproteobacteria bacterium]|nr:tyrosine-protein phosphatase [Gammaproteobacteria bacterium]
MTACRCAFKKIILILLALLLLPIFFLIGHLGYNYFLIDNVHTVIPGKIYRSAQLDKKTLLEYTQKFHLKSMINLRGAWPSNHWYQVESHFAKTHHVNYFPIKFSAYTLPSKYKLRELVHVLQTAPKPLIFHCEGGADRTGMAATISVILFEKNPTITQIERQASWHYNVISRKTVGYQVMRNYFEWLKKNHYLSSKKHFLQWVNSPAKMKPYSGWFAV